MRRRLRKVLDFGLAKLTDREATNSDASTWANTESGVVVGTVQYMSPEQARGLPVDARTDIWSLGVVLYEMVSGRAPHEGNTASDMIVSILEREPRPLTERAPGVPTELERIVHKCLEKNPGNRYQSAKEMQIDLRRLSSPSSAPANVAPARHRRRWSLLAAIVPLLILVVVLGVWLGRQTFQPDMPSLITTPLTSFVGWEIGAGLSQDAKFVAFASNRYGQMEIFVLPTTFQRSALVAGRQGHRLHRQQR